jgi:hypothetical protein
MLFGKILSKTLLPPLINGYFLSHMYDVKHAADCTYVFWLQHCEDTMWRRTSGGPTRIWPAAQLATSDAGKPQKAGGRDNTTDRAHQDALLAAWEKKNAGAPSHRADEPAGARRTRLRTVFDLELDGREHLRASGRLGRARRADVHARAPVRERDRAGLERDCVVIVQPAPVGALRRRRLERGLDIGPFRTRDRGHGVRQPGRGSRGRVCT